MLDNQTKIPVKPVPVDRLFILRTYKGNRIAIKLMRLLKSGNIYKVKRIQDNKEFVTFEILISSKKNEKSELEALIAEIVSYIPDHFPLNYQFGISRMKLGFVYSFNIEIGCHEKWFSHRIKEINKSSIMPTTQIYS